MTIIQMIQNYWELIAYIITVAISWWRFSIKFSNQQIINDQRIADLEKSAIKMESRVDAVYPILVTLQTDMASVKTSLEFIKGSVGQIVKNQ